MHVSCITAIPVLATCIISSAEATHLLELLLFLKKQGLVSRWRMIGLVLKLAYDNLEVIKCNNDNVEDRAAAMLHQWLSSGRATKQALVEAVQEAK